MCRLTFTRSRFGGARDMAFRSWRRHPSNGVTMRKQTLEAGFWIGFGLAVLYILASPVVFWLVEKL